MKKRTTAAYIDTSPVFPVCNNAAACDHSHVKYSGTFSTVSDANLADIGYNMNERPGFV